MYVPASSPVRMWCSATRAITDARSAHTERDRDRAQPASRERSSPFHREVGDGIVTDQRRPRTSPRPTPRSAGAASRARATSTAARGRAAASGGRSGASAAAAVAVQPARVERDKRASLEIVEARRSRRRLRIAGMSMVGLVFGSMLGLAAFHSVLVQGQLRLDQFDTRIEQEQAREMQLRLQVAQLGAPARIMVAAGGQGMVSPDDRKFLASVIPGTVVPPPVIAKSTAKAKSTTAATFTSTASTAVATPTGAK